MDNPAFDKESEADQTNYTDHKEQNDDKARNENGEPEGNQTLYPDLSRDKLTNRHSVSPEDANTMSNVLEKSTVHMERQIGLLGGISLIVGTMIGSGIFITPQRLLERTDSVALSLCVWAASGLLATLAALSYCELGTIIPRSGGEHAYFMDTFGPLHKFFGQLPSFLFSWMTVILLKPSSLAITSMAFGRFALYPLLTTSGFCPEFEDTDYFQMSQKLLAVFIAMAIAGVNIISAKFATRVAIVFMISKITAMAIMIGVGIYNISRGEWGALDLNGTSWDSGEAGLGDIAASFYSGGWAYDGWNNLNFAMEELANPYTNLPLAIMIGIPLVTVLYLLISVSYLTAFTKGEMIASSAVAIDVGNQYLGAAKWIVPVMISLSAIGTANGSMFTAGRISYVAGRDGHMIDAMSYVHAKRLTPVVAIIVNFILSIPMIFAREINDLIDLFGFATWFIYGLALSCVVILRFTKPDLERPFRVPIILPIISMLVSFALVVVPVAMELKVDYIIVLGFWAIGIVLYIPLVYMKKRLPYMDQITIFIQCITMAAPSPYKRD